MSDRPSHIVFGSGEVTTSQDGARIVVAWAELARRYLNQKNGGTVPPGWRGQPDAEWLYEQMRLIADPPPPEDGDVSATASQAVTVVMPSSWPMLTAGEVAGLQHVSPSAVRRALREGRLAGERHGGTWLVREDHARAWTPGGHDGTEHRRGDPGRDRPGGADT